MGPSLKELAALYGDGSKPKKAKHGNRKVHVDGMTFDSEMEFARYRQLQLQERAGFIRDLRRQVVYELAPAVVLDGRQKPPLRYTADHVYFDVEAGREVVEDTKGHVTEAYRVRKHLMKHVHGIEIKEVGRNGKDKSKRNSAKPRAAARSRKAGEAQAKQAR